MNNQGLASRLLASFVTSDGPWKIQRQRKGQLILRREGIVSPLLSPLWLFGGLFLLYIGWVISLAIEHGWRGVSVLLVPAVAILWVAIKPGRSNLRPEYLEFNSRERTLTVVESDGTSKLSRCWAYADIAQLGLVLPPAARQTTATTTIIIAHQDADLGAVRLEGLEEMLPIYRAIDALLPSAVTRI